MTPRLTIVTQNCWLIPFGAPWMLGRTERLAGHQCAAVKELSDEAELVVVALQELWAFRTGLFWPVLRLVGAMQAALLRAGLVRGGHEPMLLRVVSFAVLALASLCSWLPLPFGLWDPKPQFAKALYTAGVPHAIGLRRASLDPLLGCRRWPPPLMDSGLLLCSSRPADEVGFESFGAGGSEEDFVNKGMLWARFGTLAVINTHMTAKRAAAQTAPQRAALGALAARLLRLPAGVEYVLVVGDLNHWHGSSPVGAPHVDEVLHALAHGDGADGTLLEVAHLSCDEPTNYDLGRGEGAPQGQCLDHVICVRRHGSAPLQPSMTRAVDDLPRHFSDHNLLYVCT